MYYFFYILILLELEYFIFRVEMNFKINDILDLLRYRFGNEIIYFLRYNKSDVLVEGVK